MTIYLGRSGLLAVDQRHRSAPVSTDGPSVIACYEAQEWEHRYLAERFPQTSTQFVNDPLTVSNAQTARDADVICIFIRSRVDDAVLDQLPRLRLVATRSTGFDHIDVDGCATRGVAVTNVPFYGENTVAEHTFGLILTLSRKIHQAYQRTVAGQFSAEGLTGFDLKGKTLGVVGGGSIGLHVIRIARGFGMTVLVSDVKEQPLLADVLGYHYVTLEDLLRRSDVISIHVPALPATHHLINRERLGLVKPGAVLINTARGSVVDTEALVWALDQGILAGAGLDVLEGEELLTDEMQVLTSAAVPETLRALALSHALLHRPNVVYTPHIAFNSQEARQRILDTTVENVQAFLLGQPRNLVGR